jgi:hypothetical protein
MVIGVHSVDLLRCEVVSSNPAIRDWILRD